MAEANETPVGTVGVSKLGVARDMVLAKRQAAGAEGRKSIKGVLDFAKGTITFNPMEAAEHVREMGSKGKVVGVSISCDRTTVDGVHMQASCNIFMR